MIQAARVGISGAEQMTRFAKKPAEITNRWAGLHGQYMNGRIRSYPLWEAMSR